MTKVAQNPIMAFINRKIDARRDAMEKAGKFKKIPRLPRLSKIPLPKTILISED